MPYGATPYSASSVKVVVFSEAPIRCCVLAAGVGCVSAAPRSGTRQECRVSLRGFGLGLSASARCPPMRYGIGGRCQRTIVARCDCPPFDGMFELYQISADSCCESHQSQKFSVLCQSERNFKFCLGCQRQMLDSRLVEVAIPPVPYPPRGGYCV